MNRYLSHSSTTLLRRTSLTFMVMLAAAFSASAWAQEPVPKSLSPVPEARFFDTQPTVGAPLAPSYRAGSQLSAASAVQPGVPVPRAKAAAQPVPVANRLVESPLSADGGMVRPPPCSALSGEAKQKCIERTVP